ncbi:aldo/keto reductase [Flavobacterium degerlachei]|jgi:L-glyceraldehyde 3-phosphate reductase|uniref:L-glyceraldehyde 3-phosphate reductase n=1 Tax=Flavobacterium degerlachei TaxID=229203 RepID=A0A1H3DWM9_9FLAO|nr:aldo/keto reductase [Flavobacterium degerlachei]SDX70019.1 L-glyceraldehyde 3-phosphate reductase [Flavobacterium degerlachei]
MKYNRCGKSGLLLPQISLGLWHNFGSVDNFENGENIVKEAFNKGITHFDLANNYGPVPGSAETNFGKILKKNFQGNLRDEIVITTKAGYTMWEGPYGDWGSRKYLLSSLDQSLKRMNVDYVDVFYSHRFDPETPLEETMMALDYAVRSGKALYAGISNYNAEQTKEAAEILKRLGTPCLIHQAKYSMFVREPESGLLDVLEEKGIGCIAFSPLAQGLLTDKYLKGIPENSRASNPNGHLQLEEVSEAKIVKINGLNEIAQQRKQSLAQMALAWLLKDNRITSVLIGASSVRQLNNNIDSLQNLDFSADELAKIEHILG